MSVEEIIVFEKDNLKTTCLACLMLSWEIRCSVNSTWMAVCTHVEILIKIKGEFAEAHEFASVEFTAALLTELPL